MKSWTIDEMLAERPCEEYTQERITELWAGRERLSLLEILDLPILAKDIVWVICRRNALTPEQQAEWLECIVTRAIRNHALNCGIPTVEAWAQNWLDGTDRSSTAAAAWAAWTAVWASEAAWEARAATWTAWAAAAARAAEAWAAAAWAVEAAAAAAAWTAQAAAARAAAARAAERERQVQDCREILTQETQNETQ